MAADVGLGFFFLAQEVGQPAVDQGDPAVRGGHHAGQGDGVEDALGEFQLGFEVVHHGADGGGQAGHLGGQPRGGGGGQVAAGHLIGIGDDGRDRAVEQPPDQHQAQNGHTDEEDGREQDELDDDGPHGLVELGGLLGHVTVDAVHVVAHAHDPVPGLEQFDVAELGIGFAGFAAAGDGLGPGIGHVAFARGGHGVGHGRGDVGLAAGIGNRGGVRARTHGRGFVELGRIQDLAVEIRPDGMHDHTRDGPGIVVEEEIVAVEQAHLGQLGLGLGLQPGRLVLDPGPGPEDPAHLGQKAHIGDLGLGIVFGPGLVPQVGHHALALVLGRLDHFLEQGRALGIAVARDVLALQGRLGRVHDHAGGQVVDPDVVVAVETGLADHGLDLGLDLLAGHGVLVGIVIGLGLAHDRIHHGLQMVVGALFERRVVLGNVVEILDDGVGLVDVLALPVLGLGHEPGSQLGAACLAVLTEFVEEIEHGEARQGRQHGNEDKGDLEADGPVARCFHEPLQGVCLAASDGAERRDDA